jgi:enoyl-CoA hydratase/carnithine racemase
MQHNSAKLKFFCSVALPFSSRMDALTVRKKGAVPFADIAAPPVNLLGPELVSDLVSLIQRAEVDDAVKVLVFKSADLEAGLRVAPRGECEPMEKSRWP